MNFMLNYSSLAKGYNTLYEKEQLNKLRIIASEIDAKGVILDVGCGTGVSAKVFGDKIIVGAEPSLQMLKCAKGIIKVNALAEFLPFKDRSFDAVICVTSVHNFADYAKGLMEIKRVAKGKAAISLMRKAGERRLIEKEIKEKFRVMKVVEEKKDRIFVSV